MAKTPRPPAFASVPRRRGKPLDMRTLQRSFSWRAEAVHGYRVTAERLAGERTTVGACPVCSSLSSTPFTETFGFAFVQCDACEHLYMNAPPAESVVQAIYSEDEDAAASQQRAYVDGELFDLRVAAIARPKVEYVATVVSPGGDWVDVGCATGEVLCAAADLGWDASGVESDRTEIDFARSRGLKVRECFVTVGMDAPWLASASVLSLFNVLEHVPSPVAFLAGLSDPLPAGAFAVVEVPRHPSLSSLSNLLFPQVACRHAYAPEHLHVFSEASLEHTLKAAGLTAVGIWTFGQDYQELISSACLDAGVEESPFLDAVFAITPRVQQAIDDSDFSDTMLVVARKMGAETRDG